MAKKWYILHVYSGVESNVEKALEEAIDASICKEKFDKILIPTEQVMELVDGKKKVTERKFYPGYMLIRMELNNETWNTVNSVAKITGFLGERGKPLPIPDVEVEEILARMESGIDSPKPKFSFKLGESIKIIDGPFNDFIGTVEEVRPEKGKLKVMVPILGRLTPVELDFVQVKKL